MITSPQTYPYYNLGLELHLLETAAEGECILYLWRNRRSVVVGRNQLAENECDRQALEADGGFLVRRKSGGGAVYHDLGNLNFTFLMPTSEFDEARQSEVILKTMDHLGLNCQKTGRNDLLIDGRKFSGHAYYHHQGHSYHHGTIMLDVSMDDLEKYLHVSRLKLRDRHVRSVRSRVINLRELKGDLTMDQLKSALTDSFEEVYGRKTETLTAGDLDEGRIEEYQQMFASPEWINDRIREYRCRAENRYDWGVIRIDYDLEDGVITGCAIHTDSLQADYLSELPEIIAGKRPEQLREVLTDSQYGQINSDIADLLNGKEQS